MGANMSKGKPKPNLRDLSREYPAAADFKDLRAYLFTDAPDLEAAISSSASVEMDLENLILYRLKVTNPQTIKELTEEGAPLCTFHDKIELGLVLKLYSQDVAHNLHIIRRV